MTDKDPDYAKTVDGWAKALGLNRSDYVKQAIEFYEARKSDLPPGVLQSLGGTGISGFVDDYLSFDMKRYLQADEFYLVTSDLLGFVNSNENLNGLSARFLAGKVTQIFLHGVSQEGHERENQQFALTKIRNFVGYYGFEYRKKFGRPTGVKYGRPFKILDITAETSFFPQFLVSDGDTAVVSIPTVPGPLTSTTSAFLYRNDDGNRGIPYYATVMLLHILNHEGTHPPDLVPQWFPDIYAAFPQQETPDDNTV